MKNTVAVAEQDQRIVLPEHGLRDEGMNKNSKLIKHDSTAMENMQINSDSYLLL